MSMSRASRPGSSASAALQPNGVKVHELVAENASLKARLNATLDELKTTKDICLRNYKPRRIGGNRDGSVGSTVMSFSLYADAASQTRVKEPPSDAGIQTVVSDSFDSTEEVRRLKAEVLRSHAEVASLQQALNVVRRNSASPARGTLPQESNDDKSPSGLRSAPTDEEMEISHEQTMNRINMLTEALKAAHETIAEREQEIQALKVAVGNSGVAVRSSSNSSPLFLNKNVGTDDPILDLDIPLSPRDKDTVQHRNEHSSALQSALDLTKLQLKQALEELAESRANSHSHASPARVSVEATQDVAVNVDTLYPFERLFRLYKREFTPEGVEDMLKDLELSDQKAIVAKSEGELNNQVAIKKESEKSITDTDMSKNLDATRADLIEAHEKIDELEYAIELERKERARQSTFMGSDANKQAAAEIAFLCDTLAATRSEMERMSGRLESAEVERDAAVASFHDLRVKSEEMLSGCQQITESARVDADSSIQQLALTAKQQGHETNILRGQIAALNRQLDDVKKKRDVAEKDAAGTKTKLTHMRDSVARLREDYNSQALALREARATASAFSNVNLVPQQVTESSQPPSATPIRETSTGRSVSADPTSLQALEAALDQGDSPKRTPTTLRAPSKTPAAKDTPGTVSPAPRSSAKARSTSPGDVNYKEEYQELKTCFLQLAPMVPGAVTAREVSQGICVGLEKLNERIKSFESEVRKRTTQAQTLKKDLAAAQDLICSLEKKTTHMAVMEKKLESREKQADKAKRLLQATKTEADKNHQELSFDKETLAVELDRTKEQLALARRELAEGRELMMGLIQED